MVQKQKSIPSQPAAVAMGPLTQTENNQSCKQTTTLPRWEKQIHCAVALGLLLLVRQDIRSVCKKENLASKRKTHSFVVPRESLWAVPKNSLPSAYQPRDDRDLPPLIRLTKSSHELQSSPWAPFLFLPGFHEDTTSLPLRSSSRNFPVSTLFSLTRSFIWALTLYS